MNEYYFDDTGEWWSMSVSSLKWPTMCRVGR